MTFDLQCSEGDDLAHVDHVGVAFRGLFVREAWQECAGRETRHDATGRM